MLNGRIPARYLWAFRGVVVTSRRVCLQIQCEMADGIPLLAAAAKAAVRVDKPPGTPTCPPRAMLANGHAGPSLASAIPISLRGPGRGKLIARVRLDPTACTFGPRITGL